MRMRTRARSAIAAALLLAAVAVGAQEWIYLARGDSYAVVNPTSGERVADGVLAAGGFNPSGSATPEIVPTPGGRYVFFHYPGDDAAVVVDAESHAVAWSVSLPAGSRRLQFSSMGDAIYVETADGRLELPHRRGEITGGAVAAPDLASGSIAFNRRATRVYGERDGRLVYALARNGEAVAEVRLRGGPYHWRISPNYRYLVGAAQDGSGLVLVDEQRARSVGTIDVDVRPPSVRFDESSREVYFLTGNGEELVTADTRRFRVTGRTDLDRPLRAVWLAESGDYHGVGLDGSALVLGATGAARSIPLGSVLGGSGEISSAFVVLKPGQGFACF